MPSRGLRNFSLIANYWHFPSATCSSGFSLCLLCAPLDAGDLMLFLHYVVFVPGYSISYVHVIHVFTMIMIWMLVILMLFLHYVDVCFTIMTWTLVILMLVLHYVRVCTRTQSSKFCCKICLHYDFHFMLYFFLMISVHSNSMIMSLCTSIQRLLLSCYSYVITTNRFCLTMVQKRQEYLLNCIRYGEQI